MSAGFSFNLKRFKFSYANDRLGVCGELLNVVLGEQIVDNALVLLESLMSVADGTLSFGRE